VFAGDDALDEDVVVPVVVAWAAAEQAQRAAASNAGRWSRRSIVGAVTVCNAS
jgi:hypothetical protein